MVPPGIYRMRLGDTIAIGTCSSVAVTFVASFRVVYDSGKDDDFTIYGTTTATRAIEAFPTAKVASENGYVLTGSVQFDGAGDQAKRGQCFVNANLFGPGAAARTSLCRGYLYELHAVLLGESTEPGPAGGRGFIGRLALAEDQTGNVDTDFTTFSTANAFRILHGLILFYDSDANAATRTITISIRRPFGGLPTGYTAGANEIVYTSPTLTLTVSEQGAIYIGEDFVSVNDNGTLAVSSTATAPNPLPLEVNDAESGIDLFADITGGLVGDLYTFYAWMEEWIVL